jgi:hypothetical protein
MSRIDKEPARADVFIRPPLVTVQSANPYKFAVSPNTIEGPAVVETALALSNMPFECSNAKFKQPTLITTGSKNYRFSQLWR